jgi:hypothetical protein
VTGRMSRRYLADCRKYQAILSAADHPTVKSALKVTYYRCREEEAVIRDEFARQTGISDG